MRIVNKPDQLAVRSLDCGYENTVAGFHRRPMNRTALLHKSLNRLLYALNYKICTWTIF
jgi:hypothetical protein